MTANIEPYKPRQIKAKDYQRLLMSKSAAAVIGPNNVVLQVNYGCYLHCGMCDRYRWIDEGAVEQQTLSYQELDDLFNQLRRLGTRKVTLVGTEPVMRPDLPQILKSIRDKGIKPELYTSGIKLNDRVVTATLNTETDVAFSVDGFKPESHNRIRVPDMSLDAFGKTIASIKKLKHARKQRGLSTDQIRISANFTVQQGNIADLDDVTGSRIDDLGVDVLRMSLVHGEGSYVLDASAIAVLRLFAMRLAKIRPRTQVDLSAPFRNVVDELISEADFNANVLVPSNCLTSPGHPKCHIGEYSTMIDPIGNVRPCLYLYDDNGPFIGSNRDCFVMGNIRNRSFVTIWNGDRYQQFRDNNYPDMSVHSRCRTCEYVDDFIAIDQAVRDPVKKITIGW